jgi:quercetin dioxygenase-like cupin family protein
MAESEGAKVAAGIERRVVAETAGMRFTLYSIEPGCSIPWHFHTYVSDWYICREGEFTVQRRAPDQSDTLKPGGMANVPVGKVHRVINTGTETCRFALVQGPGAYDFNRVED